jgi:uncharacterized protein YqjF (DUF2071 family)
MRIPELLLNTAHRPWPLPEAAWAYYQEWNRAVFLHWKVDPESLTKLVPPGLQVDLIDGHAWLSIVAFTMEKIRPRGLPAVAPLSDFHEINVRAYVSRDGKPGVYFINMEAGKRLAAWTARTLSGLPYEPSEILRSSDTQSTFYASHNKVKNFKLDIAYRPGAAIEPDAVDRFLTERYCLYLDNKRKIYRYEVHHPAWALQQLHTDRLITEYKVGDIVLNHPPDRMHYSEGVKVVAWRKTLLQMP